MAFAAGSFTPFHVLEPFLVVDAILYTLFAFLLGRVHPFFVCFHFFNEFVIGITNSLAIVKWLLLPPRFIYTSVLAL